MDIDNIKQKVAERCALHGAVLHSRQINALTEVLVEELAPLEARLARVEAAVESAATERAEAEARDFRAAADTHRSRPRTRLPDHES